MELVDQDEIAAAIDSDVCEGLPIWGCGQPCLAAGDLSRQ
jgi:hypothetical protein